MEKEDIVLLAQLMHAMKDIADKLEEYLKKEDIEMVRRAKNEIMKIQSKIKEIL